MATARVLLTLPPGIHRLEIYRTLGMKAPPLGLAWIAAVLEEAGHEVRILDTPTLEMGEEEWLREVKSWRPDVVGISMLTPTAPRGYRAAKLLKRELPDVVLVAGGQHPTFMYREALENGFDVVVRGEGEETMLELVNVVEERGLDEGALREVRGIAFRGRDGRVIVTPARPPIRELDRLPWPARHLLPMHLYTLFGKPIPVAHVMASRGCPYGCIYCSTSYFWGRRVRFRSPADVAEEVRHLIDKYHVKYLVFTDDELTLNRFYVRELIHEFRERGIDIPFACGARVDHLDREFLGFLAKSGCVALYVGVESASQETLDKIGKRIRVEQAIRVFQWRREVGIGMTASFILGFPWETLEDMRRTVELAIRLGPDYAQFTVLTPYPGTPLFEYARREGLIEDWDWEHYTTLRPVMRGYHFTRKQLASMLRYAYRRFYLRWGFISRELKAGRLREILRVVASAVAGWLRDRLGGG